MRSLPPLLAPLLAPVLTPVLALLLALAAAPALAETRPAHPAARPAPHPAAPAANAPAANAPKSIGKFEDWQAATHAEAGQTVCYAFTRVQSSVPAVPGRGDVVLTVTQRPSGRDAVALSAGFAYPANAEVQMAVGTTELPFYTSARSAFARDGHAVVAAFATARQAVAKGPGPRTGTVADTFGLRGFPAAYAAINKACPPK